jgi:glycosyltransferase involved in cell wall biosynthesis
VDSSLNSFFEGARTVFVDKAAWKKLGAAELLKRVRSLDTDYFLIAVDNIAAAQDKALLQAMGALSTARRFGFLEMSSGRLEMRSRVSFWLWRMPSHALHAAASVIFALAFSGYVLLLLLTVRESEIRGRYGLQGKPRRVAYLKSDLALSLEAGGSIAHTQGVIGGFESNGMTQLIVSNEDVPWLRSTGVDLKVVGLTRWFSFLRETERMANGIFFALRAFRLLRDFKPDLIYQRKSLLDLSGVLLSRWLRVPLVMEANDSVVQGLYWDRARFRRLSGWVERLQFSACSRAVSISSALLEILMEVGYEPAKFRVIYNGVDIGRFETASAQAEGRRIRDRLRISEQQLLLGFVGTFGQWHGIGVLTDAILQLLNRRGDVHFILVGDGELRLQCEDAIRAAGLQDKVTFTGLLSPHLVPGYLSACDILLSPHSKSPDGRRFFGSPTKLFEYMAASRAIVASRLDQIADILAHGRTALLFQPDSVEEFLAAMVAACDDRQLRARLGKAARADVADRYTWHANVSQVLDSLLVTDH